jgi:hypothetical protein
MDINLTTDSLKSSKYEEPIEVSQVWEELSPKKAITNVNSAKLSKPYSDSSDSEQYEEEIYEEPPDLPSVPDCSEEASLRLQPLSATDLGKVHSEVVGSESFTSKGYESDSSEDEAPAMPSTSYAKAKPNSSSKEVLIEKRETKGGLTPGARGGGCSACRLF